MASTVPGFLRHRCRRAHLGDGVRLRNLREDPHRAHADRQGELRPQARQDRQVSLLRRRLAVVN